MHEVAVIRTVLAIQHTTLKCLHAAVCEHRMITHRVTERPRLPLVFSPRLEQAAMRDRMRPGLRRPVDVRVGELSPPANLVGANVLTPGDPCTNPRLRHSSSSVDLIDHRGTVAHVLCQRRREHIAREALAAVGVRPPADNTGDVLVVRDAGTCGPVATTRAEPGRRDAILLAVLRHQVSGNVDRAAHVVDPLLTRPARIRSGET